MAELALLVYGSIGCLFGVAIGAICFCLAFEFCRACGEVERKDWLE